MHAPLPEIAVFGEWDTANLGDRAIGASVLKFCADCGWRGRPYSLGSLSPVGPVNGEGAARPGRLRANRHPVTA